MKLKDFDFRVWDDTENQIDIEVIGNIHEDENLLDNSIEQNNPNKIKRMK